VPSLRGISENTIGGLLGLGLLAAAAWGISHVDAPVALWVLFVAAAVAVVGGFRFGKFWRIGDNLLGYQSDLLGEAILALRDVISGKINVSFEEFIERGVLAPARFGLSIKPNEEIRLSVLVPDGENFRMLFESGHSLGRKENFSLSKASIAGHAFESGELQWTNDVESDDRWHPHPKATTSRGYCSLASMPIGVADETVAVLNVVSSVKGAFLKGDLTYVELLGGFLGLAWALNEDAEPSHTIASSQEPKAPERKGT
jgi:GAF domain-containing protein